MVQQISTANTNVPAAGQTPGAARNTDQFRSMLKAAVGQSGLAQNEKTDVQKQDSADRSGVGRKKERAKETDPSNPDETDAGRTQKSLLSPGIVISTDAAAAFASVKGQSVSGGQVQSASVTECGDSGLNSADAIQASGGIPPQAEEKSPGEEKGRSGATQQAFPPEGKTGRVSGTGSAMTETANGAISEQPAKDGGIPSRQTAAADSEHPKFQRADFSRRGASTASGSPVQEAQMSPSERKNGPTADVEGKISSTGSDASDGTAQFPQTGAAQAHPPDAKDSGTDGTAASNGGLPALYGNGKVVIKVSGEPEQAQSSPARQVADTVMHQMQSGKTEFQMDLYPKSLGKVSVKLTSQDGLLTVEIAAADPKTQSLLLSGSSEIRSILQASTGQNVQTVTPDQQAAQWYGQQSSDGGDTSGNRRQKRDEPRRDKSNGVESVSAELNTGDFLSMIQQISAYAR